MGGAGRALVATGTGESASPTSSSSSPDAALPGAYRTVGEQAAGIVRAGDELDDSGPHGRLGDRGADQRPVAELSEVIVATPAHRDTRLEAQARVEPSRGDLAHGPGLRRKASASLPASPGRRRCRRSRPSRDRRPYPSSHRGRVALGVVVAVDAEERRAAGRSRRSARTHDDERNHAECDRPMHARHGSLERCDVYGRADAALRRPVRDLRPDRGRRNGHGPRRAPASDRADSRARSPSSGCTPSSRSIPSSSRCSSTRRGSRRASGTQRGRHGRHRERRRRALPRDGVRGRRAALDAAARCAREQERRVAGRHRGRP